MNYVNTLQKYSSNTCHLEYQQEDTLSYFTSFENLSLNYREVLFVPTLPFSRNGDNLTFYHKDIRNSYFLNRDRYFIKPRNYNLNNQFFLRFNNIFVMYYLGCLFEVSNVFSEERSFYIEKILLCPTFNSVNLGILFKKQELFNKLGTDILAQGTFFIDPCINTKPYTKIKNAFKDILQGFQTYQKNSIVMANIYEFIFNKKLTFVKPPVISVKENERMLEEVFVLSGFKDKVKERVLPPNVETTEKTLTEFEEFMQTIDGM